MNVIDTARGALGRVLGHPDREATQQTVTVACSQTDADALWRDADRLSTILGDLGRVRYRAPEHYDWLFHPGDDEFLWSSELHTDTSGLRFTDGAGNIVAINFRPAPQQRGTQMTLRAHLPVPELLAGAALFTVLYRARALLQTGEVPTLAANPSAR